jgi:hypothetical protein
VEFVQRRSKYSSIESCDIPPTYSLRTKQFANPIPQGGDSIFIDGPGRDFSLATTWSWIIHHIKIGKSMPSQLGDRGGDRHG